MCRPQVTAALLTQPRYRDLAPNVAALCAQVRAEPQVPNPCGVEQQQQQQPPCGDDELGKALRHVLFALARHFKPFTQCVSIVRDGLFLPKTSVQWHGQQGCALPKCIYVEDPLVGGSCLVPLLLISASAALPIVSLAAFLVVYDRDPGVARCCSEGLRA